MPVPTDYQHAVDLSQGFLGVGPGGSVDTAHTVKSAFNSKIMIGNEKLASESL